MTLLKCPMLIQENEIAYCHISAPQNELKGDCFKFFFLIYSMYNKPHQGLS